MESNKLNTIRIMVLTIIAIISFMIFSIFPALRVIVFFIGASFICISYLSKTQLHVITAIVVYSLIVILLDGDANALVQITTLVIPSVILGYFLKYNKHKEIDYIIPTMLTAIAMMYFFKTNVKPSDWENIEKYLKLSISSMPDSNSVLTQDSIGDVIKTVQDLMPSLIIIFAMIYNIFSKYIAASIIRSFQPENQEIPRFRQFYVPRELGILFVITYVVANVLSFTNVITDTSAQNIVLNTMYVLTFALAFQGLAILIFVAGNIRIKILRFLILLISYIMFLFINPPLVIIALIDIFLDIRKLGFRRSK